MALLPLRDGRWSLEFGAADTDLVGSLIKALHGSPDEGWSDLHRTSIFGGSRFIDCAELDDPRLIATCEAGTPVLRSIVAECRKRSENARAAEIGPDRSGLR